MMVDRGRWGWPEGFVDKSRRPGVELGGQRVDAGGESLGCSKSPFPSL